MKKVTIHQVDAFTKTIFSGNPAGVVFDADSLTLEEMKNIAREMNLSETAFILKPTKKNVDIKLRYFTSGKSEIKFCGHATIGTLYELARTKKYEIEKTGRYDLAVETNAGILPMTVIKKSKDDIAIQFSAPPVSLEPYSDSHKKFAKRFHIPLNSIDKRYPIMIDKNLQYIYLTITSLKELERLEFNFQTIIENFKDEGIVVFCLLTPETFDKKNHIHARGLAPLVGVNEDPVTGSMQAGLATYVKMHTIIPTYLQQLRTEQGNFIGRPGFAEIDITKEPYTITGYAAHVFSTKIQI